MIAPSCRHPLAAAAWGPLATLARLLRGFAGSSLSDAEENMKGRPTTPWVRQVISGVDLMGHPKYNKVRMGCAGTAIPAWSPRPEPDT